jgi:hypothetical protein
MGAKVQILFLETGVYTFTTKAGEDYVKGIKTVKSRPLLQPRCIRSC